MMNDSKIGMILLKRNQSVFSMINMVPSKQVVGLDSAMNLIEQMVNDSNDSIDSINLLGNQ